MTFEETLDAILATSNTALQVELIDTLPDTLQAGENPPYEKGLQAIASISDSTVKQALIGQVYKFNGVGDEADYDVFDYIIPGYIESNPGIKGNAYSAYIGKHYSDIGEET